MSAHVDGVVDRAVGHGRAQEPADLGDGRSISYAQAGEGPDLLGIHGALMTLDEVVAAVLDVTASDMAALVVAAPREAGASAGMPSAVMSSASAASGR